MRLQKQKYRHDPDNGTYGDCHRTAVAMCLGLDRDDVPHFLHDNTKNWSEFGRRVDEFLATKGMAMVQMPFNADSVTAICDTLRHSAPLVPCILGGTSANGTGHSVVVFRGELFDPAIDDSGIVGPMSDGYFWLTFFCPAFNIESEAA